MCVCSSQFFPSVVSRLRSWVRHSEVDVRHLADFQWHQVFQRALLACSCLAAVIAKIVPAIFLAHAPDFQCVNGIERQTSGTQIALINKFQKVNESVCVSSGWIALKVGAGESVLLRRWISTSDLVTDGSLVWKFTNRDAAPLMRSWKVSDSVQHDAVRLV